MAWIWKKQVHLFGIGFFFIFNFIFYYARVVIALDIKLSLYCLICLVFALHLWFFNYFIFYLVNRFYPGLQPNIAKRLLAFGILIPISVVLVTLFQSFFFDLLNSGASSFRFYVHYEDIGMNLLYSLITIFFLELIHYFGNWTKALTEAAELRERNIEAQLQSLKSQISPHFLFNSLNSLSSLIRSKPEQAVKFVHELSGVYRYLLQSKDHHLSKLEEELKFLHSYMHLLQTRFGDGLQYEINIERTFLQYQLPSFTLQLLVENAVKHNTVSVEAPLVIRIFAEGNKLIVKNNLQKRKTAISSYNIGLTNIISKYRLLTNAELEISETSDEFNVVVPLLSKSI